MDVYGNKKALDELSKIYLNLDEISADTALAASKEADKKRGQLAAAGDKEGAAKKAKQAATKITGTVANPSKPSVKLTALEDPTIINTEKGMKNQPRSINKFLKNGKYKFLKTEWSAKLVNIKVPKIAIII